MTFQWTTEIRSTGKPDYCSWNLRYFDAGFLDFTKGVSRRLTGLDGDCIGPKTHLDCRDANMCKIVLSCLEIDELGN